MKTLHFELHEITEKPEQDGWYFVFTVDKETGGVLGGIDYSYTVKYGWNTSAHSTDHAIDFMDAAHRCWATRYWAPIAQVEEETDDLL